MCTALFLVIVITVATTLHFFMFSAYNIITLGAPVVNIGNDSLSCCVAHATLMQRLRWHVVFLLVQNHSRCLYCQRGHY